MFGKIEPENFDLFGSETVFFLVFPLQKVIFGSRKKNEKRHEFNTEK
jgi:hypothetical protein